MIAPAPPSEPTTPTRGEFVRAIVEQSWARPDAPRPTARPHIALMVAVIVCVAAVGAGVVLQLWHPVRRPQVAPPVPPPRSVATYTAVSGWDCASGADYGLDVHGRTSDWYTVASGGWAQDGCHGTFEAIPMSGDKGKDDPNQYAVWWFTPGPPITRCSVLVFRPKPDHHQDSAATAAQFYVLAGRAGDRLASFVLDETASPGSWATAGTYPVSPNGIAVQLVDRGVPAASDARLALTQVKISCTS